MNLRALAAGPGAAVLLAAALVAGTAGCGAVTASTGRDAAAVNTAPGAVPSEAPVVTTRREARATVRTVPVEVADPVRVVIPAIGVDAEVVGAGLREDGQLDVPEAGLAGWYTEGPRPGEQGPAVVVAHVSTRQGPDVFADLHRLRPGDVVEVVRADGNTGRWQVRGSEQTPKDELPARRIWNATGQPVLRLVTCGGAVRPDGHFADNVIVYADPLGPAAPPPPG